ncbi:RsiV family protein [Castellaniella sp. FW104-16D08]|uniref:RsiV family protein n=1 Tax=unclassified Castellaniella TaxID=2617606 RepID=UPI00331582A3
MHTLQRTRSSRSWHLGLVLPLALALSACASGPQDGAPLIPAETAETTAADGLFAQPVKWSAKRPGCTGECPKLVLDSLAFPGHPQLTTLIDHALAAMTWLDTQRQAPYNTVQAYQEYFWKTAGPRDETDLIAKLRYRNTRLTVVELIAGQYRTGMAHGMTGTQLINWDNQSNQVLTIDQLLAPGARPAFDTALKQAHSRWLQAHQDAVQDMDSFARMWPFVSSDNVGLTDQGLLVKYQPYEIAPYAWGQPEIMISYPQLRGILKSRYLPPGS